MFVPFSITVAPGIASPFASVTFPVTVCWSAAIASVRVVLFFSVSVVRASFAETFKDPARKSRTIRLDNNNIFFPPPPIGKENILFFFINLNVLIISLVGVHHLLISKI